MAPTHFRIRDANLEVRPDLGCLLRDTEEIYLRPKTFQILLLLLEQRHRVVSKDEIAAQVWPDTAVTDDAVVQCIVEIRKVLGDDAKHAKYIRTLSKSGYRFVGAVDVGTQPGPADRPAESVAPSPPSRRNFSLPLVVAVAFVSVAGTAMVLRSARTDASAGLLDSLAADSAHRPTIAVMFLENRSKTQELDWLREGLADMLVTGLSRSRTVSVVGRQQLQLLLNRTGHTRGADIDLPRAVEIAGRTNLDHIVLGSFAKLGNTIRIDLRLHDRTGRLVKTDALTIDTPDDLLKQVDLLSWRLAQHFGDLSLTAPASTSALTTNLEAYRHYSLGLSRASAFRNDEAVALFTRATELDPEFAMAFGRIGYAYGVIGTEPAKAGPYLAKAYTLSHRLSHKDRLQVESWNALVHLDYGSAATSLSELVRSYPMEVESYSRLGLLLAGERRYDDALQVFRRGLAVDPESPDLWNRIGGVYDEIGRTQEGISARQKYVALQPNEANAYDSLGMSFQVAGRYDDAVAAYQRALEINPKFGVALVHLGNSYVQMGRYDDACETYRRYLLGAGTDAEKRRGHRNLAIVELKRGRLKDALALARLADAPQPLAIVEARIRIAMGEPADRIASQLQPPPTGPNRGSRLSERAWHDVQGQLALKRRAPDEAIEHFRAAVRDRPMAADPEVLEDVLANAYLELGRFEEAIAEYERILRINPRYPLVHYRLGLAFEGRQQSALAKRSYEQFLSVWAQADGSAPEILNARERLAALQ